MSVEEIAFSQALHLAVILEFLETTTPEKYDELQDQLESLQEPTAHIAKTLVTLRDKLWVGVRVDGA